MVVVVGLSVFGDWRRNWNEPVRAKPLLIDIIVWYLELSRRFSLSLCLEIGKVVCNIC